MKKLSPQSFDFVVFDFDGVLVDSVSIKTKVFKNVLSGYSPEQVQDFMNYHRVNGGVSRWQKFEYFLKKIVKCKSDEVKGEIETLAANFATQLAQVMNQIEVTPGAKELLEYLKHQNKKCFIVSGASETEVCELIERNGLEGYFSNVLGSPKTKSENLTALKETKLLDGRGILIGDSYTDFKSAQEFNLPFIYMSMFSEWHDWKHLEERFYLKINNLIDLIGVFKNTNEEN